MKKHLITNLVYGQNYSDIFLDFHLPAFLDPTNIPSRKDRTEYIVFTDDETAAKISYHPNWLRLKQLIPTELQVFDFENKQLNPGEKFGARYSLLIQMFKESVNLALKKNAYLSAIVADLIPAKNFLPLIQDRMDSGNHGAVFMLPLRSSFETMVPYLKSDAAKEGALPALDLFNAGYANLHPLWQACHYENPLFSKIPFSLLWNSGTGLIARSFSITPIIFTPTVFMNNTRQVIDVEIPAHCENPYWCTDWTEAPIIGAEPLGCYYPCYKNNQPLLDRPRIVGEWANKSLHPTQFQWLNKPLYYPSKEIFDKGGYDETKIQPVIDSINGYGGCLV